MLFRSQNYEQAKAVENRQTQSTMQAELSPQARVTTNAQNLPELPGPGSAGANGKTDKDLVDANKAPSLSESLASNNDYNTRNSDPDAKGWDEFQQMGMSAAGSAASSAIEGWFGDRKVTAEVALGMGERGVRTGSVDLLLPLFDNKQDLIYTQFGARRSNQYTEDYRNTVNLGAGYRRSFDQWLLGTNAFYDNDTTGKNSRVGVGAEAWTNNLKLSANGYFRLSDWKKSPDLDEYLERPANGWDVRADAYLPSYPQLGGKLMYEQYYGDEVALFGSSDRQKNPRATTVGISYTPIPLVSVSADYKQGQDGLSQTAVRLGVNYVFGVDLAKQLSSDSIISAHALTNARYNLVDRNNQIVLDYKKNNSAGLKIPTELRSTPLEVVSFPVSISGTVNSISWTGSGAAYVAPYNGSGTATITLPAFNAVGTNSYTLQAVGVDASGRPIVSNVMIIGVDPFAITLIRSKAVAMADGADAVQFIATLEKPTGEALPDTAVAWTVQGDATVTAQENATDTNGKARLSLVSFSANSVRVMAKEPQGAHAEEDASFIGDPTTARVVGLTATPASIAATGSTTSTLVATIKDANGLEVGPGVVVTWATTAGSLASSSTVTDNNSKATVVLTSPTTVGAGTVTATAVAGSANTVVNFVVDDSTAKVIGIVATPSSITADGVSTSTLVATVQDANGNAVGAGLAVSWATTAGTLASSSTVTDATGKASVVLTSATLAGSANITATAPAGAANTSVTFGAGAGGVVGVVASPASIGADGITTSTLVATVQDAHGNPVAAGVAVTWATTAGTLASTSTNTNASGKASVVLTSSTVASLATITATATAGAANTSVAFTAGAGSVVTLVPSPPSIAADGSSTTTVTATVEDSHGNPVDAGIPVNCSTTEGTLNSSSVTTDANGKAVVILTSSTTAGTAVVSCSAPAGGTNTNVEFVADSSTAKVIGVVATPTSIPADGVTTSTLVATVQDAHGNPVAAGVAVTWATSAGTLASTSTNTNASGKASVVLTSSTVAGSANVTATAVAGAANAPVTFTVGAGGVVGVVATPTSITADGETNSTLVATVEDAHGNPVAAGVAVTWATTGGTLASSSTVTDAAGKATVTLKASTTAGVVTVTATAPAGSANTPVTFLVGLASDITLVPSPSSITADGTSQSTITATIKDENGNPVAAGVELFCSTTDGTLVDDTVTTNASGIATVVLTSSTTVGTANLACSTNAGNANTNINFVAGSAAAITVNPNPATIDANGVSYSTLVATVEDAHGNPVYNAVVAWNTSAGTLVSSSTNTDINGMTVVNLTSSTVAGTANITATTNGITGNTAVAMVAGPAAVISVVATPSTIVADGLSTSTLTATVRDANGNSVPAGTNVSWTTNAGTLAGASTSTNASGVASVVLTSSATMGTATVVAASGSATGNASVTFGPGPAALISLTATPTSITADGVSTTSLVAFVSDASGRRIQGATVTWATTAGTLANTSTVSALAGRTTNQLTSSTVATNATVTATVDSVFGTTTVTFTAGAASSITVVGTPSSIVANGTSTSTMTATVRDVNGNLVPAGSVVSWSTTLGTLASSSTTTNASGVASVVLTAGTATGTATVGASTGGASSTGAVTLTSDAPVINSISASWGGYYECQGTWYASGLNVNATGAVRYVLKNLDYGITEYDGPSNNLGAAGTDHDMPNEFTRFRVEVYSASGAMSYRDVLGPYLTESCSG